LIGAQPNWKPAEWAGIIERHASLRAQLNRARNKGVTVSLWPSERAHDNPELRRLLGEWLRTRPFPPLHFLVEPETLQRLADRKVFVAERDGVPVGFLVASPVPLRSGWLIEQNIRGTAAPNGTAELMIDTAARWMAASGAEYMTLGLVPLSHRADIVPYRNPPWLALILGWIRAHGRRFYNFEGLDAFKAKFQPREWEPIYAIEDDTRFRVSTLFAVASAFSSGSIALNVVRALGRAIRSEARWLTRRWRRLRGRK
jgi:phosphatidylglycerol lysyltransferase